MDRYRSFAVLAAAEVEGEDYRLVVEERSSDLIVIAPHGGWIEPATSEIARAIAADEHALYCFEGLKPKRPHGDLHITSTRFDEPVGRKLVASASFAIAVHGRADGGDKVTTWLGGADTKTAGLVGAALEAAGFACVEAAPELAGRSRNNICNSTRSGLGVQLELPRGLRDQLLAKAPAMIAFATAVRSGIAARPADQGRR